MALCHSGNENSLRNDSHGFEGRRINENMVWTDSQDYGADEILYTARAMLFDKINQLIREIIILFEVYPRLFPGCSPVVQISTRSF